MEEVACDTDSFPIQEGIVMRTQWYITPSEEFCVLNPERSRQDPNHGWSWGSLN